MIRILIAMCLLAITGLSHAEKIRDIADIEGVRDNTLVGYGLVVGLDGTGDQVQQAPFSAQGLRNMLSTLGITIPPGTNLQLRNVAAVMVTGKIPAFAGEGQELDVVVSGVANAKSLRNGVLLLTPMKGVDGQVYAFAQGNVLISGATAESPTSSVSINAQVTGRIPGGAILEKEIPTEFVRADNSIALNLRDSDFTTARRVSAVIDKTFGMGTAVAKNARNITVSIPDGITNPVTFMSELENLDVFAVEDTPRVVVNSRTGSVVLTGDVTLRPSAVAHGSLRVEIDANLQVATPPPFSQNGDPVVFPRGTVDIDRPEGVLKPVIGADLSEIIESMNALGATTDELIAILEALKASGALRADLEVI